MVLCGQLGRIFFLVRSREWRSFRGDGVRLNHVQRGTDSVKRGDAAGRLARYLVTVGVSHSCVGAVGAALEVILEHWWLPRRRVLLAIDYGQEWTLNAPGAARLRIPRSPGPRILFLIRFSQTPISPLPDGHAPSHLQNLRGSANPRHTASGPQSEELSCPYSRGFDPFRQMITVQNH